MLITRYVALISGLGFGSENQDLLSLQMFSDLVTGELGSVQVRLVNLYCSRKYPQQLLGQSLEIHGRGGGSYGYCYTAPGTPFPFFFSALLYTYLSSLARIH